jgi:pyruvate,orthophosphate dikinase
MFGEVVMGIHHHQFETVMEKLKAEVGAKEDADLTAADLRELIKRFKALYESVSSSKHDYKCTRRYDR